MKILAGIDGSRYALAAVRFIAQHLPGPGTKVDLIHVLSRAERATTISQADQQAEAQRRRTAPQTWLRQAEARLTPHGFEVSGQTRAGVPARIIPELVGRGGYDLVVVGAKGRSDTPFLEVGSVAFAVLEHAPTNVLMVREREPTQRQKQIPTKVRPLSVLFPTDGKSHSLHAVRTFFEFFDIAHLRALAVAVAEEPEPEVLRRLAREQLRGQIKEIAQGWLEETTRLLAENEVRVRSRLLRGRPASAIIKAADQGNAGLIVLGSRGPHRPWGIHLGSVALEVALAAPCSVLLAPER